MKSLSSLNEVLDFFSARGPLSESDFFIEISGGESPNMQVSKNRIPVTAFTIPGLGISFAMNASMISYTDPAINMNSFSISFLLNESPKDSVIHNLHSSLYNENGTLRLFKLSDLPSVSFHMKYRSEIGAENPVILAKFTGCKFSYPIPSVNLSSTGACVFSTTVSYRDYELMI